MKADEAAAMSDNISFFWKENVFDIDVPQERAARVKKELSKRPSKLIVQPLPLWHSGRKTGGHVEVLWDDGTKNPFSISTSYADIVGFPPTDREFNVVVYRTPTDAEIAELDSGEMERSEFLRRVLIWLGKGTSSVQTDTRDKFFTVLNGKVLR